MYTEPPGFDRRLLAATLRRGWGIAAGEPVHVPAGFGSHHYRAGERWWVNVDATTHPARLDRALRAVVALAGAGLEFVHAPRPLRHGGCVAAMPGGYAVSVFEYVEGESFEYGLLPDGDLRDRVLPALRRLHATRPALPPEPDTLRIPHRGTVLHALDRPWTGGPFGEPARALVSEARDHLRGLLHRYDRLAPRVLRGKAGWVVTHGEPHAGNVISLPGGGIKLIDWDTVRLGPPERDLWMIAPQDPHADPDTIEVYRLWWELSEICGHVAVLRGPHAEDADTRVVWRELRTYLTGTRASGPTGGP